MFDQIIDKFCYYNSNIIMSLITYSVKENLIPTIFIGLSIMINSFAHIVYIGFTKNIYPTVIIENTFLIWFMIFINFLIKYLETNDKTNYSWLNILIDFPVLYMIISNIYNSEHNQHEQINQIESQSQSNNYTTNQYNQSDDSNESNESTESTESTESNESNESNNSNESNQDDTITSKTNYMSEEEYHKLNSILCEKYDEYINSLIYEYEYSIANLKESIRLNDDDVEEIEKIIEDKLSSRQVRLLIRTINSIYQKKIEA